MTEYIAMTPNYKAIFGQAIARVQHLTAAIKDDANQENIFDLVVEGINHLNLAAQCITDGEDLKLYRDVIYKLHNTIQKFVRGG